MHSNLAIDSDVPALHQALIDKLRSNGNIKAPLTEAALRAVPRHLFLPGVALDKVYSDEAILTKYLNGQPVSSSSQPAIMAIMLEQLGLEPGQRVLEIGAGTGYNAALIAHIVGDSGQVVTLDIDEDIVNEARQHLATAGFKRVQVVCGDGGFGYPIAGPYDRIILTVGAWDIAPAWREQLKPGGRLLLPLSIKGPQVSVAFEKTQSHLTSVSLTECGFMMLRGAFAEPGRRVQLGPDSGLRLSVDALSLAQAEEVFEWLTGPGRDWQIPVQATPREVWWSLTLWLALREHGFCELGAEPESISRDILAQVFGGLGGFHLASAAGLLGEESLCVLLMRPLEGFRPPDSPDLSRPFDLFVRSFGPDHTLAYRLMDQVTAWDTAGRPSIKGLRIRAYPNDTDYVLAANEFVVHKRWTKLVINWQ